MLMLLTLPGCRSKKEVIYLWEGEDESRRLTLQKDNTFILEIDAGYYLRVDTGRYVQRGDTLVMNPDRGGNVIDSLLEMDSLFYGHRFLEVMQPVITFGDDNTVIDSHYRGVLFPVAIVNGSLALSIDPNDPSYRKLLIPDSVSVRTILVRVPEERTCKPELTFRLSIPQREPPTKSYRVYIRSHDSRIHYLAGFKWLLEGDTIKAHFIDEWCTAGEMRLARRR